MGKIIITGGQMENKGAQAMTFTVINEIKMRYPDKEILVNCSDEDRNYAFDILRIGKKLKVELLGGVYSVISKFIPQATHVNVNKSQMKEILKDTEMIVDISGFALSSQFSFRHSINYLVNIMLAKKHNVPMVLLSQSFGPFEYKGLSKFFIPALIKRYITYPKLILAREQEGKEHLSPYTTTNVKRSMDIVLQGANAYNMDFLFQKGSYVQKEPVPIKADSVAIIPNVKTMKYGSKQDMLNLYNKMVDHLLSSDKNVYLIRHSTEDLHICQDIKQSYLHDDRVVLLEQEFDCIEIHKLLKEFQFVVASRYHSIIHSYKNGVPVLALGWATKYKELLNHFEQNPYIFDVRELRYVEQNIMNAMDRMLAHREDEAHKISRKMIDIYKESIFSEVFNFDSIAADPDPVANELEFQTPELIAN